MTDAAVLKSVYKKKKRKEILCFEVLVVLFCGLRASPVGLLSLFEVQG
jgi:hypothetical protein